MNIHPLFEDFSEFTSNNRLPRSSPLLAVAVGSGRVTRAAVESGADWILALNAGVYRHQGVGSLASFLAFGNANAQTLALLREHCLPHSGETPVFAGVLASDPTTDLAKLFDDLHSLGVEGVTNWPAVGFIDGQFREALESAGCGVAGEAEMLAAAKKAGFATLGFALAESEVRTFLAADVDGLVLNLGLTRWVEDLPQRRDKLQASIVQLRQLLATAHEPGASRRPICLAFGGPMLAPEDFETLFRMTEIDGFAGGSVFERFPVASTVASTVRGFKSVSRSSLDDWNSMPKRLGELIGRSSPMLELFRLIKRLGSTEVNVCLSGETGTGKEIAASMLHRLSPRSLGPFVTVNCGAIPDSLLESELFGHEKGAFTGAHRRRLGKFELADGGTLLLDEIGDLSMHGQVALLRVLQQREIVRVGGETPRAVDVRIIAATHIDLASSVAAGKFRADLYFRLNEFTITMPPLRSRIDDLPLLTDAFLQRISLRLGRQLVGLSASFHEKLSFHGWPGNVRELQHTLLQAALFEDGSVLTGSNFQPKPWLYDDMDTVPDMPTTVHSKGNGHRLLAAQRVATAEAAIKASGGNKAAAARDLGITRKTLYSWINTVPPK